MRSEAPIGYFVHHQGRGHAERAAAIANVLVETRPVVLFSARTDIFPELDERIDLRPIPSLFEPQGDEAPAMAALPMPATTHCAPLGWPAITQATATLAQWFADAKPALFVTDVSAELGQLARLCSVPHVAVLQHGERGDPGHMAAYESAVGLLAPYSAALEQSDRPSWMRGKTHYASGVGIAGAQPLSKAEARRRLGLSADAEIVLVLAGGGGEGTPSAPLTLGARAEPDAQWITIGKVRSEWHETPPGNLDHRGWVDNPRDWIAAADRIVSSCGNTTVHMVVAAGRPWIVVPEWRYFDEQLCKAEVLDREGLAAISRHWPSHAASWAQLWTAARLVDCERQRAIVEPDAATQAAQWLADLARRLWAAPAASKPALEAVA
jgi:predicted glycosyltransferase